MATRNEYTAAGFVAADPATEAVTPVADPSYTQAGFVAESTGPGIIESLGRGALEGATFGFEDELGLASREAQARSRAANPWSHFAGEVGGGLIPMAAAALLPTGATQAAAGARAASLGARGLGMLRAALVPGEMNTLGQAALQGAKLGTTYGALSGAGHAEPDANATGAEAALSRLGGAALGAGTGAAAGTGLGAAGYGASRLLGAAIARLSPDMATVLESARHPESQGLRDVMKALGYDNYSMADVEALRLAMRDPTQAHRFSGLNLMEALEARQPPQPVTTRPSRQDWDVSLANTVAPETTTLQQPVRVSPALNALAQDMAHVEGTGSHKATQAFAQRRAEMAGRVGADVDHFFGTGDSITGVVNRLFGSGNRAADEAAIAASREAFNKRYDKLREGAPILLNYIRPVLNSRAFRSALQDAAERDVLANPATGGKWRWLQDPAGVPPDDGLAFILSPANLLDIHHSLVMRAKPPTTGATPESVQAAQFKNWWSRVVDEALGKRNQNLRQEYSLFKRQMEATERGRELPLNTGGSDHASLEFFRKVAGDKEQAGKVLARTFPRSDKSLADQAAGRLKNEPELKALSRGMEVVEGYNDALNNFRKAWGERISDEITASTNPVGVIRRLLTTEGRDRIGMVLGDENGAAFSRYLHGQLIKEQIAAAKSPAQINALVREHLSPRGQRAIMNELGPQEGRTFIESLMNKQQQAGLSERLFGNSDTAYKTARQKRLASTADAATSILQAPFMAPFGLFKPSQLWQSLREMASNAYTQRRADQVNSLLSRQGPQEVGEALDAILARNQLATTGQPYTINPLSKAIGPTAATIPSVLGGQREQPPPFLTPYRP